MGNKEKYADIRGLIRAKYKTQQAFADKIKMHPSTLSAKLTGRSEWAYAEVVEACKALDIALADASAYFFD